MRTRFRWFHIDQAVTAKSSTSWVFVMSHDSNSLKPRKLFDLRKPHTQTSSQTTSNSRHDHVACRAVSGSSLHRSHREQSVMVRPCKFCFVGSDSRVALHRRFLTLFGTCRDQMLRHKVCSALGCMSRWLILASCLRNLYPDLLV